MAKEFEDFVNKCESKKGRLLVRSKSGIGVGALGQEEVYARCDTKKETISKTIKVPSSLKQKISPPKISYVVKNPKDVYKQLDRILAEADGTEDIFIGSNGHGQELRVCTETTCYIFPVEHRHHNGVYGGVAETCLDLKDVLRDAKTKEGINKIRKAMADLDCSDILGE